MSMDPNDPDTLYAGTGDLRYGSYSFGSTGLLKTTDAGETWEILGTDIFDAAYDLMPGEFPQYQAIGKVVVDPRDSNNVVVGTKTGLYLSRDAGTSWDGPCYTNEFLDQRQDVTGLLAIDNGNRTTLIVAQGTRGHPTPVQSDLDQSGANGIYRGTLRADGCPTFDLISRPDNGWPAGTGQGQGYPSNLIGRIDLAVSPSDSSVMYAQVADPGTIVEFGMYGVWRTQNGGNTWNAVSTESDFVGCLVGDGRQNWYNQGVIVHPTNPEVIFLNTTDTFRSVDRGNTLENVTCSYSDGPLVGTYVHVDRHGMHFVGGDPNKLLLATDGGLYYTENAQAEDPRNIAFVDLNSNLGTIEFYSGDISANFATANAGLAIGGAQDNGTSVATWNGARVPTNWVKRFGGDGISSRIEPKQENRIYLEYQNGNMRISTSGPFGEFTGGGWPWEEEEPKAFLFPFEIDRHNCPGSTCDKLIAGTYRVWETNSGGLTPNAWYPNSPDLTKGVLQGRSIINRLRYAIPDSGAAIAGTNDGNVWVGWEMGQGAPNSATWTDVTGNNTVLPNRPVLDTVSHGTDPWIFYAAVGGFNQNTPETPGHIFRLECLSDFCTNFTWQNKSGNLPNVPVNSVMVNPHLPNQVFAGTDWGLFFTDDITLEQPIWFRFEEGLPPAMIWEMQIDRGFTTLALFTRGRGAYAMPLPRTASGGEAVSLATSTTTLEEGNQIALKFSRVSANNEPLTLDITLGSGTAEVADDFHLSAATVEWGSAEQGDKTVYLVARDDFTAEDAETIALLFSSSRTDVAIPDETSFTIANDEDSVAIGLYSVNVDLFGDDGQPWPISEQLVDAFYKARFSNKENQVVLTENSAVNFMDSADRVGAADIALPRVNTTVTLIGNNATFTLNSDAIGTPTRFLQVMAPGTLTIQDVTFKDNALPNNANGAVVANVGNLIMENVVIENNEARLAGGVYANGISTTLHNVTLANNHARHSGGAVYLSKGELLITGSTLTGNTADKRGGAVFFTKPGEIQNSLITENSANYAALSGKNARRVTLSNTALTNNDPANCATLLNIMDNGGNTDNDGSCALNP